MSVICLENTSAQLHPNVQLNTNKKRRAANAQQKQAVEQGWYIRQVGYRQRDEIQYWQQVTWNRNKWYRGTLRNIKLENKSRSALVGGKDYFSFIQDRQNGILALLSKDSFSLSKCALLILNLVSAATKTWYMEGGLSLSEGKWQNCTSLGILGIFDSFSGNEPSCGQMAMLVKWGLEV